MSEVNTNTEPLIHSDENDRINTQSIPENNTNYQIIQIYEEKTNTQHSAKDGHMKEQHSNKHIDQQSHNTNIPNNRQITSPTVECKIPDTLSNDKDFKIAKDKPENKIDKLSLNKLQNTPSVPLSQGGPQLSSQVNSGSTIVIPEANQNQVDMPQNESTIEYLENLKKALRTKSSALKCPFCQKQVETEVTKKCSIINIICAIITTPILWGLLKCCRGKDCNCYDAIHKCKRCKKEIADYSAC